MDYDSENNTLGTLRTVRIIAGIALIAAGCVMGFWIFKTVKTMFKEPETLKVFTQIMPTEQDREMVVGEQRIILPAAMFQYPAYLIGAILLWVLVKVAIGFISAGGNVINSSTERLEAKFMKETTQLKQQIDEIKNQKTI